MDSGKRGDLRSTELIPLPKRSRVSSSAADVGTDEIHDQVTLPDDLIFMILVSLPADFLSRIQLVCKKWFDLINSLNFATSHAKQAETVLIARELTFSPPEFCLRIFDLDLARDRFVKSRISNMDRILASCDGLVLARTKTSTSLILANPFTRKHTELPLSSYRTAMLPCEMYSLAFCNKTKEYKVVHIYREKLQEITCEILSVRTRKWKQINNFSTGLINSLRQTMISVDGTLYWMPIKHGATHLVCMNVQDEKFETKKLPVICAAKDQLIEIGGVLGLLTHVTHHVMQVWILDRGNEKWIKKYEIDLNFGLGYSPVPVCSRNGKEMVFAYPGGNQLYVYDMEKSEIKLAYSRDEVDKWSIDKLCIPHRNTLVSWD